MVLAQDGVRLTVWIGHFVDDARLQYDTNAAQRFRLREIQPAGQRNDSITGSLERAAAAGAHVVLLPELTVDLSARRLVAEWLNEHPDNPFAMVVAGSFHEDTDEGWYNTAELWNRHGEPILKHRKLRLFGEAEGFTEDVAMGNRLDILVTSIGTFALLICKDFMDDHASVATLLQEVPVDWALVPSYGDERTVRGHFQRALRLARVGPGTNSIIANQRNVELSPGDPCPGFGQPSSGSDRMVVGPEGGAVRFDCQRAAPNRGPDELGSEGSRI